MVSEGWADFHRDLRGEMVRDALIVDVRGNRGGHTSQLVVEKLARRVIGWDVPRGLQPSTYPQDAPRGPVVALADEFAGSDGDIVTAAIKILHLGPVVGTRTWGGVIGIDVPSTSWSTAPRSPCRGTRPGWTATAGASRTTASIRTSRWSRRPTTSRPAWTRSWRPRPDGARGAGGKSGGHRAGHLGQAVQAPAAAARRDQPRESHHALLGQLQILWAPGQRAAPGPVRRRIGRRTSPTAGWPAPGRRPSSSGRPRSAGRSSSASVMTRMKSASGIRIVQRRVRGARPGAPAARPSWTSIVQDRRVPSARPRS